MKRSLPFGGARATPFRDGWILAAAGLAALGPLVVFHRQFAQLFWFGDEFDLIDVFDRIGVVRWIGLVFAENFVPLFKSLWIFIVLAFHGSYFAMLAALWLTHAANTALLGRVMRTAGLSWTAVGCAQIVFGLTPANIETLGWTVQWSGVLSCTFLFLGLDRCLRAGAGPGGFSRRTQGAILAYSAASAACFSRGVVTGPLLAIACLWPAGWKAPRAWRCRATAAVAALVPAVTVAALIRAYATGNYQHMQGHYLQAAIFGTWYYCLNPGYRLFAVESWGWHTVVALGCLKLALVVWTLVRSRGSQRLLFVLLVGCDLANAVLLGIGRYHTGLAASISSRYQYVSLIGILPLAGFFAARQLDRIPSARLLRPLAAACVLLILGYAITRSWPETLEPFAWSRGTESRRILTLDPHPAPFAVPGIPFMPTSRAKKLIEKYSLH